MGEREKKEKYAFKGEESENLTGGDPFPTDGLFIF